MQSGIEVIHWEHKEGLPKSLKDKIISNCMADLEGNLLSKFVDDKLLPAKIDVLLLDDLNGIYNEATGANSLFGFLSEVQGLYVNSNHIYTRKEGLNRIKDAVKKRYGVDFEKALLLPSENINYSTLVHETLHDVFQEMEESKVESLINDATQSFDNLDKFCDMLDVTNICLSHFNRDKAETGRLVDLMKEDYELYKKENNKFYAFGNLEIDEKLYVIDEYIANYMTNNRVDNKFQERYLPESFNSSLIKLGYKSENAIIPPSHEPSSRKLSRKSFL